MRPRRLIRVTTPRLPPSPPPQPNQSCMMRARWSPRLRPRPERGHTGLAGSHRQRPSLCLSACHGVAHAAGRLEAVGFGRGARFATPSVACGPVRSEFCWVQLARCSGARRSPTLVVCEAPSAPGKYVLAAPRVDRLIAESLDGCGVLVGAPRVGRCTCPEGPILAAQLGSILGPSELHRYRPTDLGLRRVERGGLNCIIGHRCCGPQLL